MTGTKLDHQNEESLLSTAVAVAAASTQAVSYDGDESPNVNDPRHPGLTRLTEHLQHVGNGLSLLAALGTRDALDIVRAKLEGGSRSNDEGVAYANERYAAIDALARAARIDDLLERIHDSEEIYDIRERALGAALLLARKDQVTIESADRDPVDDLYWMRRLRDLVGRARLDSIGDLDGGPVDYVPGTPEYPRLSKGLEQLGYEELGPNDEGRPEFRHGETRLVFVLIPGGTTITGSPEGEHQRSDDETQHEVLLRPFLLAKHCVSWDVWARGYETLRSSSYRFRERLPERRLGEDERRRPVTDVGWEDARRFCALFGWVLPLEAWWEHACRAGTRTPFSFGETISASDVNFNGNHPYREGDPQPEDPEVRRRGKTVPVGSLPANAWGLHEMHGNVWEWCHDVFDARFYGRREAHGPNPLCLSGSGNRVLRGGCWFVDAWGCRSANRFGIRPWWRRGDVGFRPARPLP